MTVDWSKWMRLAPEEQRNLWRRYKQIIKAEAMGANYKRMDEAMAKAARSAA